MKRAYTTKGFNNDLEFGGLFWKDVKTDYDSLHEEYEFGHHSVEGPPA